MQIYQTFGGGLGGLLDSFGSRSNGDESIQSDLAPLFDYYWTSQSLTSLAEDAPVASWEDIIEGKVLSQGTLSAQPRFVSDRFSFPAVNFNGTSHVLFSNDADLPPTGLVTSTNHSIVLITSSGGTFADSTIGGFANAANTRRMLVTNRNAGQYRLSWATSTGGAAIVNGVARTSVEMGLVGLTASGGTLRQQYLTTVNVAVTGSWECTRMVVGANGLLTGSFADQHLHAIGVAKGAKALAIFSDFSAVLAAANSEWNVPMS